MSDTRRLREALEELLTHAFDWRGEGQGWPRAWVVGPVGVEAMPISDEAADAVRYAHRVLHLDSHEKADGPPR